MKIKIKKNKELNFEKISKKDWSKEIILFFTKIFKL